MAAPPIETMRSELADRHAAAGGVGDGALGGERLLDGEQRDGDRGGESEGESRGRGWRRAESAPEWIGERTRIGGTPVTC